VATRGGRFSRLARRVHSNLVLSRAPRKREDYHHLTRCHRSEGPLSFCSRCFLYCGFNHRDTQTPENLLSSLLKQLVQAQSASSKSVVEFYDRHTKAASSPTLKNITNTILQETERASKVFIVIDALDECGTDNGCRMKLLSELFDLQKQGNIHLLATSRALPDVTKRFEIAKNLEIRASPRDIQTYLDENMYRLPSFVGRNEALQQVIKTNITTAVDGMYATPLRFLKTHTEVFQVAVGQATSRFASGETISSSSTRCSEEARVRIQDR
jgi:hypothetical protein